MSNPFQTMQQWEHVTPVEIAKEKPWLEEPARSRVVDAVIHNLSNQLPAFVRRRGQVTNLYLVPRGPKVWRSEIDSQKGFVPLFLEINSLQMTFAVGSLVSLGEIWWNLVSQWPSLVVKESRNRLIKRAVLSPNGVFQIPVLRHRFETIQTLAYTTSRTMVNSMVRSMAEEVSIRMILLFTVVYVASPLS